MQATIFREGASHPLGFENLKSLADVVKAIQSIRAKKATVEKVIVKLNEGVSGEGNAVVDLKQLPSQGSTEEAGAIEGRLREMRFELKDARFDDYFAKLAQRGGIVEEMIIGEEVRSPSVQMRLRRLETCNCSPLMINCWVDPADRVI